MLFLKKRSEKSRNPQTISLLILLINYGLPIVSKQKMFGEKLQQKYEKTGYKRITTMNVAKNCYLITHPTDYKNSTHSFKITISVFHDTLHTVKPTAERHENIHLSRGSGATFFIPSSLCPSRSQNSIRATFSSTLETGRNRRGSGQEEIVNWGEQLQSFLLE